MRGLIIVGLLFFSSLIAAMQYEYNVSPNGCFPVDKSKCPTVKDSVVLTSCKDAFDAKAFLDFNEALSFLKEECGKTYTRVSCECIEKKSMSEMQGGTPDSRKVLATFKATVKCNPRLGTTLGDFFLEDKGVNPVYVVPLGTYYYNYFCDDSGKVDTSRKCSTTGKEVCK